MSIKNASDQNEKEVNQNQFGTELLELGKSAKMNERKKMSENHAFDVIVHTAAKEYEDKSCTLDKLKEDMKDIADNSKTDMQNLTCKWKYSLISMVNNDKNEDESNDNKVKIKTGRGLIN